MNVGPGPVLDTGLEVKPVGERTVALPCRFDEMFIAGRIGAEIFAS